ncbi:MAG TPA: beta-ketoacyl synthase N-terminal-like domain-containing protein [Planctomycetota bacterium]|nr:beta-ketoacyl synthase N-terminal-like domain-containing protein [Planctomycetota bacterium]
MTAGQEVLVTGVGAVTTLGAGWRSTLEAWRRGRVATGPIEPFEPGDLEGVADPRRKAKLVRLAACATLDAWRTAGLDPAAPGSVDTLFVSSALGCLDHSRDFHAAVIRRTGPSPMLFTESVLNAGAGHVAIERALHGGGHAVSTFLYDGLDGFRLAFEAVASGRCARALVVGCDSWIPELEPIFRSCGALRAGPGPGGCIPFSPARDGFRLGEAAGALVLESRESARRRDARGLARVAGVVGALRPDEPEAAVEAAAAAAADFPLAGWIFPSANGGVCETIEEPLLERLAPARGERSALVSIKPATGESFAGSAALHLVFACAALSGEEVPAFEGSAPSAGNGEAWVVGADPAGSVTLARLLAP